MASSRPMSDSGSGSGSDDEGGSPVKAALLKLIEELDLDEPEADDVGSEPEDDVEELDLSGKELTSIPDVVFELKALPTTAKGEDVSWQVLQMFQARDWQRPENIDDPFTEPKIDSMVSQLVGYMHAQDKRNRQLVQLVSELHAHQFPAGAPESERQPAKPEGAS